MWVELTSARLLGAMSAREVSRINAAVSGDASVDTLADVAANVAEEWRGGLRRVTVVDSRDGYVPTELMTHMLADFRHRCFTIIHGLSELLDDNRVQEWNRANTVRDNLTKVTIKPPDAGYAESSDTSGKPGPSISEPVSVLEAE